MQLTHLFQVFVFDVGGKAWKFYDWSKVTTVAAFGKFDAELMCYAHAKGARLVLKGRNDMTYFCLCLILYLGEFPLMVTNAVSKKVEIHVVVVLLCVSDVKCSCQVMYHSQTLWIQ